MKNKKINLMVSIGLAIAIITSIIFLTVCTRSKSIEYGAVLTPERFMQEKIMNNWSITNTHTSNEMTGYIMKLEGENQSEFLSITIPNDGVKPFKHDDMETKYIKKVSTSKNDNYSTYINREPVNGKYITMFALQCGDAVILTENVDIFTDFINKKTKDGK